MKILILGGAGLMGAGTVRDLLSELSQGVERVVVADGFVDRLEALAARFDDPRLATAGLDLDDPSALAALLHEADVCINAVATFAGYQMDIFEACLAAGTPYVDYGGMGVYTVKQKAEHGRWREAGATAVLGLGADPGLSNILCRAVADRLETVEAINLYWAAAAVGPESPVLVPPYAASTVLSEYANPSRQFLDGALVEVPPQSGREVLDLPPPWGRTSFMHTQHSEPLTVPFAEGIAEKGLREMTWKLHLPEAEHAAWVGLVKAGFGDFDRPVRLRDGREVKPVDVLQAVIDRNMAENADTAERARPAARSCPIPTRSTRAISTPAPACACRSASSGSCPARSSPASGRRRKSSIPRPSSPNSSAATSRWNRTWRRSIRD
jgi:saccharopine dehydrogenase-like NADP-dependent oxidoreductase